MRMAFWVLLILLLPSCFLFKDHKRRTFTYTTTGGETAKVNIIIPKGFKREEPITDSLGRQGILYHYSGNALFYVLHFPEGGNYQPIDTAVHIPKHHLQGGIFYKGVDSTSKLWWREAQPGLLRIGYLHVGNEEEVRFDSAVNFPRPDTLEKVRKKTP